jgi:hypothetical protein
MPTLLVNRKMEPALAARLQLGVSLLRRGSRRTRLTARMRAVLRLAAALGVLGILSLGFLARHRAQTEFATKRLELLNDWAIESNGVTPAEFERSDRIGTWLREAAGAYPGDMTSERIRDAGGWKQVFESTVIYARGPIAAFETPAKLVAAARDSGKDALLLCLLEPPTDRVEKALLVKARAALGGDGQLRLPNVSRLFDVLTGTPYLRTEWRERIQGAPDIQELVRLARELRRAPLNRAKLALKSRALIAAIDEPNAGDGPTELDGEHRHFLRLLVWDLSTGEVLLRQRRLVDPAWVSPNRRSQYARELDGCRAAIEVRDRALGEERPWPERVRAKSESTD